MLNTNIDTKKFKRLNEYLTEFEVNGVKLDKVTTEDFSLSDNPMITYVSYDSRDVILGTLFICKGQSFKRDFLLQAIDKGAIAYVSEVDYQVDLTLIKVNDIRRAMAVSASSYFSRPQDKLKIIGITGTKGKSTTVTLLYEVLKANAIKHGESLPALISSYYTYDGYELKEANLTTPEPMELFGILSNAVEAGLDTVVMEVSSQALKYDRVYGINYAYAAFLNISPDHISNVEHKDFEDYFTSKLKLVERSKNIVVNLETDLLERVLAAVSSETKLIKVGVSALDSELIAGHESDYRIDKFKYELNGMEFALTKTFADLHFKTDLHGKYNLENIVVVIAIANEIGVDIDSIQKGLEALDWNKKSQILKLDSQNEEIVFIIDRAHNGLSFKVVFDFAKKLFPDYKRSIVFGTVGNKSESRRKDLAEACNGNVDKVYLTRDDNNFESLEDINREIITHLDSSKLIWTCIDEREDAIEQAFSDAEIDWQVNGNKTCLFIMGKGDDRYNYVNGKRVPYEGDEFYARQAMRKFRSANRES